MIYDLVKIWSYNQSCRAECITVSGYFKMHIYISTLFMVKTLPLQDFPSKKVNTNCSVQIGQMGPKIPRGAKHLATP